MTSMWHCVYMIFINYSRFFIIRSRNIVTIWAMLIIWYFTLFYLTISQIITKPCVWPVFLGVKRIPFGAYDMVYIGTSNSMKIRSVPDVALKPSKNDSGQYFMSLYTGKRVYSYIWEELHIDNGVIQRVEKLAELDFFFLVDTNNFF